MNYRNPNPLAPKMPSKPVIEFEELKKLKFKDRLKIFLGFNLLIQTTVVVDRREGKVSQKTRLFLTKENSVEGIIKDRLTEATSLKPK